MGKKMKLHVYSNVSVNLCFSIAVFVMFSGFFTYHFGVSEAVYYIPDILVLFLAICMLYQIPKSIFSPELKSTSILILVLLCVASCSAIVNGFHFPLWLWSLRNWGRFFIYFYLCIIVLNKKMIDTFLNFTLILFHINFIVILLQFLLFRNRMSQDELNGLVGRDTSGLNILLILAAVIIVYARYFTKKSSMITVIFVLCEAGIVSAVAELKAEMLFLAGIFLMLMAFNARLTLNQIIRYAILIMTGILVIYITLVLLIENYPQFAEILTIDGIIKEITSEFGYGNSGYINRLTAIHVINKYFFNDYGISAKLFGIGMGNGEGSAFSFLCSRFYNLYGKTFRYLNFTISILYLESGIIGLSLYVLILFNLMRRIIQVIIKKKKNGMLDEQLFYENVGLGMVIVALFFICYNNLHRTDMSYLMAIYLSVPLAVSYHNKNQIRDKSVS